MRKGRIRWFCKGEWSAWYDLGKPMPEELKQIEVTAVQMEEEMTKAEYESLYGVIK